MRYLPPLVNVPRFFVTLLPLLAVPRLLAAEEVPLPEKIDFNRDIRPILSENCFKCHGFDPKTRDGGRRLDTRDGALKEIDGVRAVVPGELKESDLHLRIQSTDKDEQMPPAKSGKKLTARQKSILDRWIEQGAPYDLHWAFKRPVSPPLPQTKNLAWARNSIDRLVLARLEAEGLAPSPEADKYTLVRRLSLDLVGLPPTPNEAEAFVQDAAPDAYEKLVDRLLASPRYGERWARRWLDLARYADTNGYEKDRPRSIWPYRDWVINALNAGMPFDQFTIEQLAGDLLPNATREQRTATGFHRNTMLNEEGGIDPLEFRYHAMADRVGTTGTTWLGLTVQCAQCHTHKYDPITHREYFGMMALLNNADEPELELPPPDAAVQGKKRQEKLLKLVAELPEKFPVAETDEGPRADILERKFEDWLTGERARAVHWKALSPIEAKSNLPLLTPEKEHVIFVSGDMTKSDTYELRFANVPRGITAVRIEALADERLPQRGPGRIYYEGPAGDFFLSDIALLDRGAKQPWARATQSFSKAKFTAEQAIDDNLQTGWGIDGGQGRDHEAVFNLAAPLGATEFTLKLLFERYYAAGLGKFRISVTTDPQAEARPLPGAVAQLLLVPAAQLTGEERARLREQFLLSAPELTAARAEIDALRKPPQYTTTLVMQERPPENPRPTFLHNRGEFLQPTDRVEPVVVAAVGALPADAPPNRLAFARWLVSPENPLTARVTANREWAALFGQGIVRTLGDFGFQGEAPTHPELLDWLAIEFMRDGWSLKRLHKLIVTSATYRQSSRVTPELLARDPQNKLLARGPRFRLEAEIIRDSALRASGLLSEKMGGPGVRPPQPDGVMEAAYGNPKWNADTGEDRYRRSIYTFQKRSAPFALYNNFDAPTGEACVARRDVSNTPLQALALLNDQVFLEAARALGQAMVAQPGSVEERVRILVRKCLTRPPTDDEVTTLAKFVATQQERFTRGELDAKALAGDGVGEVRERAAWTALVRVLFNLDEVITRS
jgi:hypothetical protein